MLKGKKTYIAAAVSLAYAAAGYFGGYIEAEAAIQIAQTAIMGAFIRNGVKTAVGG